MTKLAWYVLYNNGISICLYRASGDKLCHIQYLDRVIFDVKVASDATNINRRKIPSSFIESDHLCFVQRSRSVFNQFTAVIVQTWILLS